MAIDHFPIISTQYLLTYLLTKYTHKKIFIHFQFSIYRITKKKIIVVVAVYVCVCVYCVFFSFFIFQYYCVNIVIPKFCNIIDKSSSSSSNSRFSSTDNSSNCRYKKEK